MHGPDLATRFHKLTTQQDFVRIPQDYDPLKMISTLTDEPSSRRSGRA